MSNTDQDQSVIESTDETSNAMAAKAVIAGALERMGKEFGMTMLPSDIVVSDGVETFTIATDGKELFVNEEFVSGLNDEEIRFILASTDLKLKNNYLLRKEDRDPLIWNIACDYVTNAILIRHGIGTMPKDAMLSDAFTADMTAEQVYDTLMKDPDFVRIAYQGGQISDYQFATTATDNIE